MKLLVLLVFSCSLGGLRAQEHEVEGEEGPGIVVPPCAISMERLDRAIQSFFPEGLRIVTNCLSFDENGALKSGIVSGVNDTGGPGMRQVLRCTENIIVSTESTNPPSNDEAEAACLNCTDSATDNEICSEGTKNGEIYRCELDKIVTHIGSE